MHPVAIIISRNTLKSKGDRLHPCSTPITVSNHSDCSPFTQTALKAFKKNTIKRTFQTRIDQRWEQLMTEKVEGIEEEWSKVKGIFQEASVKTLGCKRRKGRTE